MAQALKFTTTCDDTQFEQAMRRIQRAALQASDRVSAGFARAGSSVARTALAAVSIYEGIRVGKFLADGIKQAYDFGAEIDRISKRTGLFAEQVAILNRAAHTAQIENLAKYVNRLQSNLEMATKNGTSPAAMALRDLGLNAANLTKQLPADQIQAIGVAIAGLSDPARKAADTMALFGRGSGELIPFFQNTGAIGNAMTALGRQARILGDNAATFRRVSELLQDSGIKIQGFFVGAAAEISGKLLPFLERLDRVDLAGIGRQFGDGLIKGVNFLVGAFQHPDVLLGAFADRYQGQLRNGINVVIAGFKYAGESLLAVWRASPAILSHISDGLSFGLAAGAEKFGAVMVSLVGKIFRAFEAGFDFIKTHSISQLALGLLSAATSFAKSVALAITAPMRAVARIDMEAAKIVGADTSQTLQAAMQSALRGEAPDLAGPLNMFAAKNAKSAMDSFAAAGSMAANAATSPTFKVNDVANAGFYQDRFKSRMSALEQAGGGLVNAVTQPQARLMLPGYGPNGKPASQDYANQLRGLYGSQKANQMLYGEGQAQSIDNNTRAPLTEARKAQNIQLFGSYAASQMLTDKGQLKPELDPLTGAMGSPSATATAGVGAVPSTGASIGSSGYLTPYAKMRERSIAPFANGTLLQTGGLSSGGLSSGGLTSGGLGGGAYGATGNIWHELGGRVVHKNDPQKEAVNQLTKIVGNTDALLKTWQGGSPAGTGGGATAGGK